MHLHIGITDEKLDCPFNHSVGLHTIKDKDHPSVYICVFTQYLQAYRCL